MQRVGPEYGVTITEPTKGSHWRCTKAGCRMYPLPAHNGKRTEIADQYIAGFCRNFGIDEAEFRKKL
jgi:hypothetical protein